MGQTTRMSNNFSSFSFYGASNKRKRCEIQQHLNERMKEEKKRKIPEEFRSRITGPICDWRSFFRQQDAFNYATSRSSDLHVFAYESESLGTETGKRMYLVSDYHVFWHYYRQLCPSKRNHYEVIPEGAVCKLYFDLEFPKEQNPDRDGEQMVETLVKYVCIWLKVLLGVICERDSILDLDASTEKKFSRHLIFQMKKMAFQDNIHAGNFVQHIMARLRQMCQETSQHDGRQSNFDAVHLQEGNSVSDEVSHLGNRCPARDGAETKEGDLRNDRINSHQNADNDIRKGERQNKCDLSDGEEVWKIFTKEELSSLIVKNKNMEDAMFCDLGVYTKNRNFRLYKSCKYGKNNPLVLAVQNKYVARSPGRKDTISEQQLFLDSLIANVKFSPDMKVVTFGDSDTPYQQCGRTSLRKRENTKDSLGGYHSSPYPEVDQYILSELDKRGPKAFIRQWTYFSNGEMILYEMGGNRWCANIERCHKSNNIMIVADLKKRVYYQKCHDPDCRAINFTSDEILLPDNVLPSYFCDEDEFFDGEELDLLNASDQMEKLNSAQIEAQTQKVCEDEMLDNDDDLLHAVENFERDNKS